MAAAGLLLLGCLFLPWYETEVVCVRAPCPSEATGWQALAAVDLLLALAAALAMAAFLTTAAERTGAIPHALTVLAADAGLLATALALLRLLDLPDGASARQGGPWLALVAALWLVAAALVAMRDERPRGRRGEIAPRRIPAPRPGGEPRTRGEGDVGEGGSPEGGAGQATAGEGGAGESGARAEPPPVTGGRPSTGRSAPAPRPTIDS